MSGLKDLKVGVGIIKLPGYGWDSAPEVPEASPIQTTLPTSAYGQTTPVVWGKCRLPGAYIWVPPIITITSSHQEYWDTITTTNSPMSCRLRFARPLVPDSTWTLRRLWSNGTLIYDASQNYRMKGLNFRFYDGRSAQGRDPTMTKEEGTNNISAHRGYIDIVITDFDIQGYGSPPVFEAEIIQDGGSTLQYQTFQTYEGDIAFEAMIPVWDQQKLYASNWQDIFLYSIPARRQYFTFTLPNFTQIYYHCYRYSKALDRLIFFSSFTGIGGYVGRMFDGSTGELKATAADTMEFPFGCCLLDTGPTSSLFLSFSDHQQIYCYRLTADDFVKIYSSGDSWNGYSSIQCATPGAASDGMADFYVCADNDLVKLTFNALGFLVSTTVLATLSASLRYVVYDDGDLVVWTSAATVSRIDGASGSVEYIKSVPYQIESASSATRRLGDPDLNRLTEELPFLVFTGGTTSYFTDLGTGVTRSISGGLNNSDYYFYDGQTATFLTKSVAEQPRQLRFVADDGEDRLLSDFLTDLMVYGGGYESSDIVVENVDDLIQGAVVDITAGARDIARAVIDPYSIALMERSGQIVFRRALTDTSFAVDQTVSSAGDILDQ